MNSFENYYQHIKLSEWDQARLAFLPLVVDAPDGIKVIITESDLYNYPGMFLHGQGGTGMKGVHAGYPVHPDGADQTDRRAFRTEQYACCTDRRHI